MTRTPHIKFNRNLVVAQREEAYRIQAMHDMMTEEERHQKAEGPPQIMLEPIYDPKKPLKVTGYSCADFKPGLVITRAGKKYLVMPNGSQRRLK